MIFRENEIIKAQWEIFTFFGQNSITFDRDVRFYRDFFKMQDFSVAFRLAMLEMLEGLRIRYFSIFFLENNWKLPIFGQQTKKGMRNWTLISAQNDMNYSDVPIEASKNPQLVYSTEQAKWSLVTLEMPKDFIITFSYFPRKKNAGIPNPCFFQHPQQLSFQSPKLIHSQPESHTNNLHFKKKSR
jgi:hypothetical protein